VDGAGLLIDLVDAISRYVILPKHADTAVALWILFAHAIGFVDIAPILALTSPEKRCGKSTLLALLGRHAPRSLSASNISGSALFVRSRHGRRPY
jgi:putative DNA primase/helicase